MTVDLLMSPSLENAADQPYGTCTVLGTDNVWPSQFGYNEKHLFL